MKSNYFETILGSIILLFALYGLMIFFQANKSFDNEFNRSTLIVETVFNMVIFLLLKFSSLILFQIKSINFFE